MRLSDLPDLGALPTARGPFLSVTLDASAVDPASGGTLEQRWSVLERELRDQGAPDDLLEQVAERAVSPTGVGGEVTRVLVGCTDGLVVDRLLPGHPAREEAAHGPVPHVMQLARAAARFLPYAVVRLDRSGADIDVVTGIGSGARTEVVDGGHDVLHKVPGGGWSQRRYQARVEDSWERNAEAVAREVDSVVRRHGCEVVAVAGDERAWGELRSRVGSAASAVLVRLEAGGRAEGTSEESEHAAVERALGEARARRRREVLGELAQELSRQQRAVEGLDATVEALRRGQVEQLVLRDDPSSTLVVWSGSAPLALGTTREDAEAAGQADAVQVRADAALAWAVVGGDAGVLLVEEDDPHVRDDVAAVLRWSDDATPHDRVPSMPGHGESPGHSGTVE